MRFQPSWNSAQIQRTLEGLGLKPHRLNALKVEAAGKVWFEARSPRTTLQARQATKAKQVTREALARAGVPTPGGYHCRPHEALRWAKALGWPVAVKPSHGSHGAGVTTDIRTEAQLGMAVEAAKALRPSQDIVVEQSVSGDHYRVLWAGERACSVVLCRPWSPTGDGHSTILELLKAENERRKGAYARPFAIQTGMVMTQLLQRQGLQLDSVLELGQVAEIAHSMNIRQGAIAVEATSTAPPRVADTARRATEAILGLHHSAVDLVDDGEVVWVIEVNANPGLGTHLHPYEGQAQVGLLDRMVSRVYA